MNDKQFVKMEQKTEEHFVQNYPNLGLMRGKNINNG